MVRLVTPPVKPVISPMIPAAKPSTPRTIPAAKSDPGRLGRLEVDEPAEGISKPRLDAVGREKVGS